MHVPERIEPKGLADYLETMSKSVFQTGMSWRVVDSKWPDIREAMREFDPYTIARFGEIELEELANDKRVIRNRRKLQAIVDNARQMIDLEAKHGSFRDYLRSHDDFDATMKDLRKQFRFLGDMGCYHFLWVVNEEVPPYEEWQASRGNKRR
ncbi:MAG: DNA-3-methyladenine glycosylase I [Chloroflexi bacterium]|nr:DNA-3-methyladenine glycosylase I [Chloroflexota bacterium]